MNLVEREIIVSELFNDIIKDFDLSKPCVYDVSEKQIEIQGLDLETGEKKFSLLRNMIIKEPVDHHYVIGTLKATAGHLIYDENSSKFIRADEHPMAQRIDEKMFVVDFTVDDTHNYFANGLLNHNTSPGGRALKHACSVMVNIAAISSADSLIEDSSGTRIGHRVRAKVQKNKVGAPHRQAEYNIEYGKGIVTKNIEILDLGIALNLIERPNLRTYSVNGEKLTSRQAAEDYFLDDEIRQQFENICREKYTSGQVDDPVVYGEEEQEQEESLFDTISDDSTEYEEEV